ncbi:MAG: hypothetical protein B7Z02_10370 [Rhodobacterales bacterium 32-67-9]|nr:MAG: hypothetical protein B7Z02_10370 [Rhodobacterales bacterium 32-67-9]
MIQIVSRPSNEGIYADLLLFQIFQSFNQTVDTFVHGRKCVFFVRRFVISRYPYNLMFRLGQDNIRAMRVTFFLTRVPSHLIDLQMQFELRKINVSEEPCPTRGHMLLTNELDLRVVQTMH